MIFLTQKYIDKHDILSIVYIIRPKVKFRSRVL